MEQGSQRSASEVQVPSSDIPPVRDEYSLAVQRLDEVDEIDVYVDTEVDRGGRKLKIANTAKMVADRERIQAPEVKVAQGS